MEKKHLQLLSRCYLKEMIMWFWLEENIIFHIIAEQLILVFGWVLAVMAFGQGLNLTNILCHAPLAVHFVFGKFTLEFA